MRRDDFTLQLLPGELIIDNFAGGSRYESGRKIPRPVQKLLAIAYGTEKQAEAMVESLRKRDT